MKQLSNIQKYSFFYYVCGLTLFFSLPVYLEWNNPSLNILKFFYLFLVFYFLIRGKLEVTGENIIIVAFFSILFLWEKYSIGLNAVGMMAGMLFAFTVLIPIKERKKILDCYVLKIFPILLGLSTLSYILWLIGILNLPEAVIDSPNEGNVWDYYTTHVFFVTPSSYIERLRFCSYYDEPGVVGSLCAIIIYFYNRRLPKWTFVIYVVAGVLSFSFFFYIIIGYFFLTSNSYKLSTKILGVSLFLFLIAFVFRQFDTGFIDMFLGRFSFENGELVGNNRNQADFSDYFYKSFVNSPDFLFGSHDIGANSRSFGSFSIQVMIYRHGLLWTLYAIFLYVFLFWKYKETKYSYIVGIIVFIIMNYQRPSFTDLFYFTFFTTLLQSSKDKSLSITRKINDENISSRGFLSSK